MWKSYHECSQRFFLIGQCDYFPTGWPNYSLGLAPANGSGWWQKPTCFRLSWTMILVFSPFHIDNKLTGWSLGHVQALYYYVVPLSKHHLSSSIYLSIDLSICLSAICLSPYLSINHSTYLSVYLSHLFHISIYLSVSQTVSIFVYTIWAYLILIKSNAIRVFFLSIYTNTNMK